MKTLQKIFFILILLISSTAFAETKTFYVTRHGQRGDPKYQKKFKMCDEDALMPNGEEQATRLGKYLNELNFNGTIFVSPYYRTLQTATFAASQMNPNLPMILEPGIQEVVGVKDNSGKVGKNKKCISKKEIKQNFPKVKIPFGTKFPWRLSNEKQAQCDQRVGELIDKLLERKNTGDIFLVGHGGVMNSVVREMNKRGANFQKPRTVYNCCLYEFTFDTDTKQVISSKDHTLEYLPDELITDNLAYMIFLPHRDGQRY